MSDLQSPFPEYENEFQISPEFDIFWGAIDSLGDTRFDGKLFSVSMSDVSINYVPHLIENITVMPENMDTCVATVDLLSRYTHALASVGSAGMTGLTGYAPNHMKHAYRVAQGLAPSSPATFTEMILDSIDAYCGKISEWSVQQNANEWRCAAKAALSLYGSDILKNLDIKTD